MMAAMGAQALGTSSAALAFTLGYTDGHGIDRDTHLAHAQDLVAATGLPVSGDFENGYGDAPEDVADIVRLAAEAGLAGIGIEDTALPGTAPYPFDLAVERIRAALSAARALPRDFVVTARTDVVLLGTADADEALRRLQAFDEAGADCLYAPMGSGMDIQARICATCRAPVNVLVTGAFAAESRDSLARIGAARISFGSGALRAVAQTLHDVSAAALGPEGRFDPLARALPFATLDPMLRGS